MRAVILAGMLLSACTSSASPDASTPSDGGLSSDARVESRDGGEFDATVDEDAGARDASLAPGDGSFDGGDASFCADEVERREAETARVEAEIVAHMNAGAIENVTLMLRRSDGRVFQHSNGIVEDDRRYISSSTAKPVAIAAILDQVAQGNIALDTRVVDVLPEFAAVGAQRDMTLHHLLSFTGSVSSGTTLCWREASMDAYRQCVNELPMHVTPSEPGVSHVYSTAHLDIAGEMAVAAGGFEDWESLFLDWSARTGLFPGITWNRGFIVAASVQINTTAREYLDFLNAVELCTILDADLCARMVRSQIAPHSSRTSSYQWFGEDWSWGYGFWIECRSPDFDCPDVDRYSTVGVAGQYAYVDLRDSYSFVLSPPFDFSAGVPFTREIEPSLQEWAQLSHPEGCPLE